MAKIKEKLFSQFPPVTTDAWIDKVTADLKGADFEKKLVWRTNEGFNVKPMYRAEDTEGLKSVGSLPEEFPYIRGTKCDNKWLIRQDIDVENVTEANAKAKDILTKGVTSLGFKLCGENISPEGLEKLLAGIEIENVEINFSCCVREAKKLTDTFVALLKSQKADLAKIRGSVNFDPFKRMLKKGRDFAEYAEKGEALVKASAELPGFRVLTIDSVMLCNAGSYISQELGFALAWGNEYMSALTDKGLSADEVAKKIKFNFGISSNFFMEIAKFRAAKMLWAEIVAAYKPKCLCSAKIASHAETSQFNMTVFDAHVNLLRSQTETMSAALAGADSICVLPFDTAFKQSDEFSERIARNQQLLLKEEAHFDKIVDISAGSYYVENLTISIAEQAWKIFNEVEEKGGFYAAVKAGFIQDTINASGKKRRTDIARRKEILLGTNQYPNINEKAGNKITKGESCGCCKGEKCEAEFATLNFKRGATAFEDLRLTTEKATKQPTVFMLTIGSLSMRLARSQFSGNFLGCAGYKIIDNLGFETVEDGVEAAVKANADIVVLCSSDEEYATLAPAAFKALDGRAIFVVAGAPECTEELKAQGIDLFINVRSNVLETLQAFNEKLSIK
ncbi:MAG: methylmalonyl-CoA mutase small subunit [Bacteroidales bacterium]